MTKRPIESREEPPTWKGRRGLVDTGVVVILAIALGMGLWILAERGAIVPACTAYAHAHEMDYRDFKLVGVKRASTVVCLLTRADGKTKDVHLKELVPTVTDDLVSFAMSLEFTIPGFAILLAMGRVWWFGRHPLPGIP